MSDKQPEPKNNFFAKQFNKFLIVIVFLLLFLIVFFMFGKKETREAELKLITDLPLVKQISDQQTEVPVVATSTPSIPTPTLSWRSFGDIFSSSAYLDMSETTMLLDQSVAALVFPPVYKFNKIKPCPNETCGLNKDQLLTSTQPAKFCLGKNCLEVKGVDLLFNSTKVIWPPELKGQKILNISVGSLSSIWTVAFVMSDAGNERVYVYFFDGKTFKPIINDKTKEQIVTQYSWGRGTVFFGGTAEDFLIFYAGYEDIVYHFQSGQLADISRFFGLRISTVGFKPQIIRQGNGQDTLWYLIDSNLVNKKLIKLWQNGTDNIKGSYYFNDLFSKTSGQLVAVSNSDTRGQLDFIFKTADNKFELWTFQDNGFDNTINRSVVSVNLENSEYVYRAFIKSIGLALNSPDSSDYETQFPNNGVKLYLANKKDEFTEVIPASPLNFATPEKGLFWKAEFQKSTNNEYSPWFDHMNSLDYFVGEKY